MNEDSRITYYSIVPAKIRCNRELTERAKLIYSEIMCLSNKYGYCFATNKYFSDLYDCTNRSVQNAISKLKEKWYITVVVENYNKRKIFINLNDENQEYPFVGDEENCIGYENNFTGGDEKNFIHNNINYNIKNNMLDSLFNYIIDKTDKLPEEFEPYKERICNLMSRYEMNYTEKSIQYMNNENIERVKIICYALALTVIENVDYLLHKINRAKLISLYDECKLKEKSYNCTKNEIKNFVNYYYKCIKTTILK